jgi:hypothetical protein
MCFITLFTLQYILLDDELLHETSAYSIQPNISTFLLVTIHVL